MSEQTLEETIKESLAILCQHIGDISEQLGRIACELEEMNESIDHVQGTASYGPKVGFIRISNIE